MSTSALIAESSDELRKIALTPALSQGERETKSGAALWHGIPLPRGPQWYLVAYRWLVVAAAIYSVVVTWKAWGVRSGPEFAMAPMLPVWDWIPQMDLHWWMIGSLLLVLVRPWAGVIVNSILIVYAMLADQTRIQYFHQIAFLLWATLPNINAQMIGRANLISMWFWVGMHKLLSDFINPANMEGFKNDIAPASLAAVFPPEKFTWNTHQLGVAAGWCVALLELSLGLLCVHPRTRKAVAGLGFFAHLAIVSTLFYVASGFSANVFAWNVALMFAGAAIIAPWRESIWASLKQCRWPIRIGFIALLVLPVGHYWNLINAYLSHCIYVPVTTNAMLVRSGQPTKPLSIICFEVLNIPLPPGHDISELYFRKVVQPGDALIIYDPRPWAQHNGMNGRRLTEFGEFRNGQRFGHWHYRFDDGGTSEGNYRNGQKDGVWTTRAADGSESRIEYRDGMPLEAVGGKQ